MVEELLNMVAEEMAKEALAKAITNLTHDCAKLTTVFRGLEPGFNRVNISPEDVMKEELEEVVALMKAQEEPSYKGTVKMILLHFAGKL